MQGSHHKSLELLAGYLQKYTRNIENISVKVTLRPLLPTSFLDKSFDLTIDEMPPGGCTLTFPSQLPILKSELQTSAFGYGGLCDALSIRAQGSRSGYENLTLNPVLVLSFVESVLGYSPVANWSGESQWYFKRYVGFKE